jgi:apolipoprotein N-acyltransferase
VSLRKILLAILSGIMLSASFPPGTFDWMAWIAIIPLLKSLENERPLNAFRLGMIAGLAHYLTLMYWVIFAVNTYGELGLLTSTGILFLLCLYLSLFPAFFSCLVNFSGSRKFIVLITAGLWASLEYARAVLITGFPWCLLGYSQFNRAWLIQISDITGVYGISFLLAAVNVLIYLLIFREFRGAWKRTLIIETSTVLALLLVCLFYGVYSLSDADKKDKVIKFQTVSIIQGNIDQSVKWDAAFMKESMDKYLALSRSAMVSRPDLIVWPETAAPFFFQDKTESSEDLLRMAGESGAWLIFGSPAYEKDEIFVRYYNRAYLASPEGSIKGYYDKVHLVPFVEYIPLKNFLPFIHRLVVAAGDFSSGEQSGLLKMSDATAGALICYEAIFPDQARTEVRNGADFFVVLSNDAWFGMTSAPYQLMTMSIFRAVENRRPLVRATNTGLSGFIDAYGRITAESGLFTDEVLTGKVRTDYDRITFYSKYGDVFMYIILIISLIAISSELYYRRLKKKRSGSQEKLKKHLKET